MSKIVESLDRLQKQKTSRMSAENAEDLSPKDNFFSKIGILIWLGASISATLFSYHLGVRQGIQTAKADSPKQWLNYFSEFSPAPAPVSVLPSKNTGESVSLPALAGRRERSAEQSPDSWILQKKETIKDLEASRKAGFTIQVITYVSERLAKEEVDRLAQKGQKAFVVSSGKYFQVCIDVFENKKIAGKKLSQMKADTFYKTAYPGAYVKFLKQ